MFIVSQLVLRNAKMCVPSSTPSYSVAIGLVLYATIYLYLLFYYEDYIGIFNKFIIYVIGIDLLLSGFYHLSANDTTQATEELSNHLNITDHFGELTSSQHVHPFDDTVDTDTDTDISDSDGTQHSDNTELNVTDNLPTQDANETTENLSNDDPEILSNVTQPNTHDENQPSEPILHTEAQYETLDNPEAVILKKRRGRPPKNAILPVQS